jgi:hypothetical protein
MLSGSLFRPFALRTCPWVLLLGSSLRQHAFADQARTTQIGTRLSTRFAAPAG